MAKKKTASKSDQPLGANTQTVPIPAPVTPTSPTTPPPPAARRKKMYIMGDTTAQAIAKASFDDVVATDYARWRVLHMRAMHFVATGELNATPITTGGDGHSWKVTSADGPVIVAFYPSSIIETSRYCWATLSHRPTKNQMSFDVTYTVRKPYHPVNDPDLRVLYEVIRKYVGGDLVARNHMRFVEKGEDVDAIELHHEQTFGLYWMNPTHWLAEKSQTDVYMEANADQLAQVYTTPSLEGGGDEISRKILTDCCGNEFDDGRSHEEKYWIDCCQLGLISGAIHKSGQWLMPKTSVIEHRRSSNSSI